MTRKLLILIIIILSLMILLAPNQDAYFQRIANDYGELHQTSSLSIENLKEFGEFEYHNRFFYSHFKYQFGNISVSYFGFLTFIIFEESEIKEPQSPQITV